MGLFNHHTKAPQEATTNVEAPTFEVTAKDADAETPNPFTRGTAGALTNKERADFIPTPLPESSNPRGAGPKREMWCGNEDITTPGVPVSDGLVHGKVTEQRQKHHFWEKRNKDHAKVPAAEGDKEVPTTSRGQSVWAAWPERGDPLGEGNLGQGLTWR